MRRSPQHIGRKGHQFLSQALRPRRIVLYVVFVLLGAVLSVVGIYGISALKLYTEANRFISASEILANTALGCGGGGNIGVSARVMVTSTRALRAELDKSQAATVNAEKFMGIVRKHLAFEELTPTLLREMIEKIVVHECSYDENGTRRQDIEIYYSFVGKIDLPE